MVEHFRNKAAKSALQKVGKKRKRPRSPMEDIDDGIADEGGGFFLDGPGRKRRAVCRKKHAMPAPQARKGHTVIIRSSSDDDDE